MSENELALSKHSVGILKVRQEYEQGDEQG